MSAYARLKARLDAGDTVLLDGATGTELQRRGAPMEPTAWCGPASVEGAAMLRQIHLDYIAAGSRVITANTFATSRIVLSRAGLGDQFAEINRTAIQAALAARDASGEDVVVAGSLSHMIPRADLHGPISAGEIADSYAELAETLADEGCDLILLEMMFRPVRIAPAFAAAAASGLPYWAGFSARRAADGRVLSFAHDDDIPFAEILDILDQYAPDAAGVMHSESEVTGDALALIRRRFAGPLTAYPDSGHMKMPDWQFEEIISLDDFKAFAADWVQSGAQVLGGCCGLGVEHIRALGNLPSAPSAQGAVILP